jgi:hypothetical protein
MMDQEDIWMLLEHGLQEALAEALSEANQREGE